MNESYDVIVIGGGAAGLSGALSLARARRSVLVVDAGEPRNRYSGHMHAYLGLDGIGPAELVARGRGEVESYGGEFVAGEVVSAKPVEADFGPGFVAPATAGHGHGHGHAPAAGHDHGAAADHDPVAGDAHQAPAGERPRIGRGLGMSGGAPDSAPRPGFEVALADGTVVRARRLLVATGVVDGLPEIDGLAARWGRDVLHCPYCHGWEVRGRRVGIIASGPAAEHVAPLWRQWTDQVILFLDGGPEPTPEAAEKLAALSIPVVPDPVESLEVTGDALSGVRLATGTVVPLTAAVVPPISTARSALLESLGARPEPQPFGSTAVPADPTGRTSVPGVFAAGNVTAPHGQVILAASAGNMAGAMVNFDLVEEDTARAVAHHRRQAVELFEADAWEARYQAAATIWSGNPNPHLATEAADLAPGRALDIGSGEGADAIWLAARGWQVTGVDIAQTALDRAAANAEKSLGSDAARITWQRTDLRESPPTGSYDLINAQFMHLPLADRRALFTQLAAAVAPGGTLLIVGHHPGDLATSMPRMHFPGMLYTPEDLVRDLDKTTWDITTAESRPRDVTDADGNDVTIHDTVLVARRRA